MISGNMSGDMRPYVVSKPPSKFRLIIYLYIVAVICDDFYSGLSCSEVNKTVVVDRCSRCC